MNATGNASDQPDYGPDDPAHGHIPDALVYGPANSRRFGRSLGVSCSWPGAIACRWRCPYCQLGDGPRRAEWAPRRLILAGLKKRLDRLSPGRCDIICIAGAGEPTDHPDFARLAPTIGYLAASHGLRSVLLTNGDGLADPQVLAACGSLNATYVKFDPGPRRGAWRRGPRPGLESLRPLRIQAMVYGASTSLHGNDDATSIDRWLDELRVLAPDQVQVGSIARSTRLTALRPTAPQRLALIIARAREVLGPLVEVSGH